MNIMSSIATKQQLCIDNKENEIPKKFKFRERTNDIPCPAKRESFRIKLTFLEFKLKKDYL